MAKGDTRKATIHGVDGVLQTEMQAGKWYTNVHGRIKIANEADPATICQPGKGYMVLERAIIPVADRWAYTCLVEYPVSSGHTFPGSDFIDTKDASGLSKAETSCIGRALALAGIAIEEGIASTEEMRRADQQGARRQVGQQGQRQQSQGQEAAQVTQQLDPHDNRARAAAQGFSDYGAYVALVTGHEAPYSDADKKLVVCDLSLRERGRVVGIANGAMFANVCLDQVGHTLPLSPDEQQGVDAYIARIEKNYQAAQTAVASAASNGR